MWDRDTSPRLQGRYGAFAWEDVTVVTTGARATELHVILSDAGWRPSTKPSAPRLDRLPAEFAESIMRVYHDLGGVQECPRLAPGSWDLAYSDLLVELDESFHFNRYRESTLSTQWGGIAPLGRGLPRTLPAVGTFRWYRWEAVVERLGQSHVRRR